MSKFLCFGDPHLGASPDLGRVPFGEGSRLEDQERVLRRILHLAVDEKVDGILNAGDVFHRRRPTPSEMMVWRSFVEGAGDEGIGIVGVLGNHEVEAADRVTATQVIRGSSGGYYDIFARLGISYAFDGVAIACLPWTPPARLLASLNGHVERDEVAARVAELLIDSARELRAQIPEGKVAVLLLHWSISGSSLPNGLDVGLLREPVLALPDLAELGFDAIVAGHIHKPQRLDMGLGIDCGPILYTGSAALVDFGESQTEHGVWILDTETMEEDRGVFHEIEDRRFLTVDCDLTETEGDVYRYALLGLDETDAIAAAVATHFPIEDAVLRIRYRCTSEQARKVDVAAIRNLCADDGVSKIYSIQAQVEREDRVRAEGLDENLTTLDALEVYVKSEGLAPEKADALRRQTALYLEEVGAA